MNDVFTIVSGFCDFDTKKNVSMLNKKIYAFVSKSFKFDLFGFISNFYDENLDMKMIEDISIVKYYKEKLFERFGKEKVREIAEFVDKQREYVLKMENNFIKGKLRIGNFIKYFIELPFNVKNEFSFQRLVKIIVNNSRINKFGCMLLEERIKKIDMMDFREKHKELFWEEFECDIRISYVNDVNDVKVSDVRIGEMFKLHLKLYNPLKLKFKEFSLKYLSYLRFNADGKRVDEGNVFYHISPKRKIEEVQKFFEGKVLEIFKYDICDYNENLKRFRRELIEFNKDYGYDDLQSHLSYSFKWFLRLCKRLIGRN